MKPPGAFAAAVILALSFPALADTGAELALKLGGGTNPVPGPHEPNPLAFGIGGAVGVTFASFYVGLSLFTYFGAAAPSLSYYAPSRGDGSVSVHSLLVGVEGGYGVKVLSRLTIRPQIGIGDYSAPVNSDGGALPGIAGGTNLYVEPEVAFLVDAGRVFVGADAGILVIPSVKNALSSTSSDTFSALVMNAQVGVRF